MTLKIIYLFDEILFLLRRGGERETDRQTGTERETDRQAQRERQTDRERKLLFRK